MLPLLSCYRTLTQGAIDVTGFFFFSSFYTFPSLLPLLPVSLPSSPPHIHSSFLFRKGSTWALKDLLPSALLQSHDWRKALNDLAVTMRMENYAPEAYFTFPWRTLWSFFPLQCTGDHIPRTCLFLLRGLDGNLTAPGEVDSVTLFENRSSFLHHWLRACGIPGTLLVYIISHNGNTGIHAPNSHGHPSETSRTGTRCLVSVSLVRTLAVTPQVFLDLNEATS